MQGKSPRQIDFELEFPKRGKADIVTRLDDHGRMLAESGKAIGSKWTKTRDLVLELIGDVEPAQPSATKEAVSSFWLKNVDKLWDDVESTRHSRGISDFLECAVNEVYSNSRLPQALGHSERTLHWLCELNPEHRDNLALRVAALVRNMDRCVEGRTQPRSEFHDGESYRLAHCRSASEVARQYMEFFGVNGAFVNDVCAYVEKHEFGGEDGADDLCMADKADERRERFLGIVGNFSWDRSKYPRGLLTDEQWEDLQRVYACGIGQTCMDMLG